MALICNPIFFILLLWPSAIITVQVKWSPNTSFNLPLNFMDGKRPCGRQAVHFPSTLSSAVRMSSENDVNSLIMPIDGELSLSEGATILFGPKSGVAEEGCSEKESYYVEKTSMSWLQADVWESERFNAATPDAQRIPCFEDDVVFPESSQFSVTLPDAVQRVRSVTIAGNEVEPARFKEIAESPEDQTQTFILNSALSLGVSMEQRSCQSRAGCPCQDNATIVDCSASLCSLSKCKDPVLPDGNCCPICGGFLKFDIDIRTFDFMSFQKSVEAAVNENGGKDKIVYHVGLLWKDRVQVVMVDIGDYEGNSALTVHTLSRRLGGDLSSGFRQSLISGPPLSKVGTGAEIAGVTFLFVVLTLAAAYVWYQRPDLVAAITLPAHATNMFSRLNHRESVTSMESRGSVAFGSSFRNPLYSSKRGQTSSDVSYSNVSLASTVAGGATVATDKQQDGRSAEPTTSGESATRMSLIPDLEE